MSVCLIVKKKRLNSNYSDAQDKLKKDFGDSLNLGLVYCEISRLFYPWTSKSGSKLS